MDDEKPVPGKKRRKRRRKREEESGIDWEYYSGLMYLFSLQNILTVVFVLTGIVITCVGLYWLAYAGALATPLLSAGIGIVVITLACRFVFFGG